MNNSTQFSDVKGKTLQGQQEKGNQTDLANPTLGHERGKIKHTVTVTALF